MEKPKVTSGLTISLDGFGAGYNQSFEQPFGENFDSDLLDRWMFSEPERQSHKKEIDSILDAGAFIMGSNMFGRDQWNEHGDTYSIQRLEVMHEALR